MRNYELVLVFRSSLKDVDRKKLIDTVKNDLKDAKDMEINEWGQKPLAYNIKKEFSGFYVQLKFSIENLPAGFEQKFFTNEEILRHLLLRTK